MQKQRFLGAGITLMAGVAGNRGAGERIMMKKIIGRAIAAYEAALRIFPNFKKAQDNLAKVKKARGW